MTDNGERPKLLLTPEEAAAQLGIGRSKLYEILLRGEIKSVKIGRRRRITPRALEEYIERLEEEAAMR